MKRMARSGLLVALVLAFSPLAACDNLKRGVIEAEFDASAKADPAVMAIKTADPALYARLRDSAINQRMGGTSAEQTTQILGAQVRQYVDAQMPLISQAPAAAQLKAFQAEAELLKAFRPVDIQACANAAMGSAQGQEKTLDASVGPVLQRVLEARLQAARAGRTAPTQHPLATQQDGQRLHQTLIQNGVSASEADRLFGVGLYGLPAQRQCDVGIAFVDAILSQPEPSRTRMVASVLAALSQRRSGG